MKCFFILPPLVLALVLLLQPQKQLAQMEPAVTKTQKEMAQAFAGKVLNSPTAHTASAVLKAIPTTQELMDSFRTKPTNEIRLERARILKMAESRNLYAKSNQESMTASDRDELAYVIRANTALSVLLVERELEKN